MKRRWLRPLLAVACAAWVLAGCSGPEPFQPPRSAGVTLEGATVVWSTSAPTLGAVRFGARPAQYRAVAYPEAARRGDKSFTVTHRVPLLSARPGDTVYVQVLDQASDGSLTASPEYRFAVTASGATRALLTWTMIDVGFGDAHLLTLPGTGRQVLIDAGERRDWPNVDAFLRDSAVTRLDAVLATHIHEDHIGGLVGQPFVSDDGVLGAYDVGAFLDSPNHSGVRAAYDELLSLLTARGIPRLVVSAGETDRTSAALAWDPQVGVQALHAGDGRATGGESENDWINNDSIVLRITYGEVSLMMGGDAESPVESRLLALQAPLESELLKVHHHGVSDASDPAYLSAVNPRVGLIPITTYESSNGTLPSPVVLERLRQRNIGIYASDRAEPLGLTLSGDAGINVTALTDGVSYQVVVAPSRSHHEPGSAASAAAGARSQEGALR